MTSTLSTPAFARAVVELQELQRFVELLTGLPPAAAYALIAAGSAIENIFPPVPSDTFVVLGAVLSDRGGLEPTTVLLCAWLANLAGAMAVYGIARKRGPSLFHEGWGRRLLRPHQFARVTIFYERWGLWAIFFSRFLPVLRVVIPTFAGFAGLGVVRTAIPVATASLLWNGVLLAAGILASRNVGRILRLVGAANVWLLVLAALFFAAIVLWWIRSRREERGEPQTDVAAPAERPAPDEAPEAGRQERSGGHDE